MEENVTTTLADFWVSETEFYQKGYYSDYITNPEKRFRTVTEEALGDDWWSVYREAYVGMLKAGKLIFRAKVVTDDTVTIYQIYESKQDRQDFLTAINTSKFQQSVENLRQEKEYGLNQTQVLELIDKIADSKSILQQCRPDYRKSGMVIGDPLKTNQLIYV